MTLTLLIDLDNTLLSNDMGRFIPAYLGALGKHLADYSPPERIMDAMMAATRQMFANNDPSHTLKEVFDSHFYPALGLVESKIRSHIDSFYVDTFPSLKGITQPRVEAQNLVREAFARGYQVGVATNPLFPRTAILQRLDWAGLPEDGAPFSLIPSYEGFHFAKPNPAYFAEFLGRMGWPEGSVVMVGDDPDHDIRGARAFGLPIFWISKGADSLPEDHPQPTWRGSLPEILPWLESTPEEELVPDFSSTIALIAILRAAPASLQGLLMKLVNSAWTPRPYPTEWSVTEVICHLRDVELEVNLPRLRKILAETNPFIPGVDSDVWARERNYICQDGPDALKDFIDARLETLKILEDLEVEDWDRPIRHAIFGPTDLKEIIRIMAGHERLHGRQVYKVLKKIAQPVR